jgi:hypothetical protein
MMTRSVTLTCCHKAGSRPRSGVSVPRTMAVWRRNTKAGWRSAGARQQELEGGARLKSKLGERLQLTTGKLRLLFPRESGGISGRLLTFAEVASEMSGTYPGRVVTCAVSLALTWILLGGLH